MPYQEIEWIAVSLGSTRPSAEALSRWYALTGIPHDPTEREAMMAKVTLPRFFSFSSWGWAFYRVVPPQPSQRGLQSPWEQLDGIVVTKADGRHFIAYKSFLPVNIYEFSRIVTTLAQNPLVRSIGPVQHTADEVTMRHLRSTAELYAEVAGVYATVPVAPEPTVPVVLTPPARPAPTGVITQVSAVGIGAVAIVVGLVAYLMRRRTR